MKKVAFSLRIATLSCVTLAAFTGIVFAAETIKVADLGTAGEWELYKWNKAQGKISVSPEMPEALKIKGLKGTLEMKISWPGGEGMRFFSVVPTKPVAVNAKASKASIWIKGSPNLRYLEIHFLANGQEKDASGKQYKISLGQLNFDNWKQMEAAIPADWPMPLMVKSLTLHDWKQPQPAEDTIYAGGLELRTN